MSVHVTGIHGNTRELSRVQTTVWIQEVQVDIVGVVGISDDQGTPNYDVVVGSDCIKRLFARGYAIGAE